MGGRRKKTSKKPFIAPISAPRMTAEGIGRYLASGMICGIGPVYAKKLVRGFGEQVFDIIEEAPQRLREPGRTVIDA